MILLFKDYELKNIDESAEEYYKFFELFTDNLINDVNISSNKIYQFHRLYALLYEYMTTVPASTYEGNKTFVSLFDYLKLTGAIASCLYLSDNKLSDKNNRFYMLEFDLSGIQKFIYKISESEKTKKGVAKNLRGRSLFISMITNFITYRILKEFGLTQCNIIFNTGGGALILLPYRSDTLDKVDKLTDELTHLLYKNFNTDITFVSAIEELNQNELERFQSEKAIALKTKLEEAKFKKFANLDLNEQFYFERAEGRKLCEMCESTYIEDGVRCKMCEAIECISDMYVKNDKFSLLYDFNGTFKNKLKNPILKLDNYTIYQVENDEVLKCDEFYYIECINHIGYGNVRFNANLVPKRDGTCMNFSSISDELVPNDIGDKKLGILKMDVDNLGAVFAFGLKQYEDETKENLIKQRLISKFHTLSRLMELFFSVKLKKICENLSVEIYPQIGNVSDNKDMFYINYAGGDDLLIIGPSYGIIQLAKRINDEFEKYVNNDNITLSGGIYIQKEKAPIRFGIQKANDELNASKNREGKHGITILGVTMSFDDYGKVLQVAHDLKEKIDSGKIGRTCLYQIMNKMDTDNYDYYLSLIPIIQYVLYRNVNKEERLGLVKLLCHIKTIDELKRKVLTLKLAVMYTRD